MNAVQFLKEVVWPEHHSYTKDQLRSFDGDVVELAAVSAQLVTAWRMSIVELEPKVPVGEINSTDVIIQPEMASVSLEFDSKDEYSEFKVQDILEDHVGPQFKAIGEKVVDTKLQGAVIEMFRLIASGEV